MKRFPLEPLRRVRDLRLDAARRTLTQCRIDMENALRRRDIAKLAWSGAVDRRARHQRECALAASNIDATVVWLGRADRHRLLIDAEIARCEIQLRGMDEELERARQAFADAFAAYRRAQSKVDALDNFRGEWARKQQRELERREEQAGEELYLAVGRR